MSTIFINWYKRIIFVAKQYFSFILNSENKYIFMPSFDVVSQIDYQEVLNAVNGVQKEIGNRYDFKSVKWSLDLDKKEKQLVIIAESDYCLGQIQISLKACFTRRKLDPRALDFQEPEKASGNSLRQIVKIKEGIEQEMAKKIMV